MLHGMRLCRSLQQLLERNVLGCSGSVELAGGDVDPQIRMPAQPHDGLKEPSGKQPAIGQHQHGDGGRNHLFATQKQPPPMSFP